MGGGGGVTLKLVKVPKNSLGEDLGVDPQEIVDAAGKFRLELRVCGNL